MTDYQFTVVAIVAGLTILGIVRLGLRSGYVLGGEARHGQRRYRFFMKKPRSDKEADRPPFMPNRLA